MFVDGMLKLQPCSKWDNVVFIHLSHGASNLIVKQQWWLGEALLQRGHHMEATQAIAPFCVPIES